MNLGQLGSSFMKFGAKQEGEGPRVRQRDLTLFIDCFRMRKPGDVCRLQGQNQRRDQPGEVKKW